MRNYNFLKNCVIFFLLSLLLFSCSDKNCQEIKIETQPAKQNNLDKESVFFMYENIRKITDKYSESNNWHFAIKKKEKWETDTTFDATFSIDISTEPRISIFFYLNKELLISDVKSYLNKGDTIIFTVSNIHYEQQTIIFYPVDSIKKIVRWNTVEDGEIVSVGNYIDFPNPNN